MANNATYSVPYRRKRDGKTDYKKRMKLLLGRKTRLVVRRSSKHFSVQLVEFHVKGDKIVCSAHSKELVKYGWKGSTSNSSAAYLTGLLAGSRAKAAKVETAILDIGLQPSTKGSRLYAAAKGILDSGIKMKVSENVFPAAERISGAHIAKWAGEVKNKNFFSAYKVQAKDLPKHFEEVRQKILGAK